MSLGRPGGSLRRAAFVAALVLGALRPDVASAAPTHNALSSAQAPGATASRTDRFIIRYSGDGGIGGPGATQATARERTASLSQRLGRAFTYTREMSGGAHVVRIAQRVPIEEAEALALRIRAESAALGIDSVEPDRMLRATFTPNDPMFAQQWHLQIPGGNAGMGANLPGAWDITTGDASTVMALIDTGVRKDHPDLAGRFLEGYDFVSDAEVGNDGNGRDSDPSDPGDWVTAAENATPGSPYFGCGAADSSWHGTHVAGIMGATGNNNVGVAGANWKAKLLPIRVLGKCGGYTSDIIDALRWAAGGSVPEVPANRTPARVINLSLGGTGPCAGAMAAAVAEVVAAGAVIVVAAGNSNDNVAGETPGNCPGVIAVGASDHRGERAPYSNYGSRVTISAPGGNTRDGGSARGILSTLNAGKTTPGAASYAAYQGTSMATPLVAGIVGLMLAANPALTPDQVTAVLRETATPFPSASGCTTSLCGAGIVNAAAAVAAVANRPGATTTAVNNGSFERGRTGWIESSTRGYAIIGDPPGGAGETAHGGRQLAWLGGLPYETASIEQRVSVTRDAPYLVFWASIHSTENGCGWDLASVRIDGKTVHKMELCERGETGGWREVVVDLRDWAGKTVALRFDVSTDGSLPSSLFIDDVTFQASPYH
ncbi:MAG: S8 family serine peptidase [Thermoflexales bacterium]|nr:S8 family serine peptidase [Thermoflexales bacterium]